MGHNWKSLTTEDKAPYETKAKSDKERYDREKKAYAAKKEWFNVIIFKVSKLLNQF